MAGFLVPLLAGAALGAGKGKTSSSSNSLTNNSTNANEVSPSINVSIGGGIDNLPIIGGQEFDTSARAVSKAEATSIPDTTQGLPVLDSTISGLGNRPLLGDEVALSTPSVATAGLTDLSPQTLIIGGILVYGAYRAWARNNA